MYIKCMKTKITKLLLLVEEGQHTKDEGESGLRTACRTAGWSALSTALLHDGRHALLVLPLVLLVELSGLTVGRTVGVRFIKQGLAKKRQERHL